jgi:ELWxxDGT repeat protein
VAYDGIGYYEQEKWDLWKSDGTSEGTVVLSTYTQAEALLDVEGTLYFKKYTSGRYGSSYSLMKSEQPYLGTEALLSSSEPITVGAAINGSLYFSANDGEHGHELWVTDGTPEGTIMLKDIFTGTLSSEPESFVNVNGTLYFSATDGVHGRELWKSDGTEAGTVMLKDIASGSGNSNPQDLTNVAGRLYFSADYPNLGRDLWMSDGTEEGTVLVEQPGMNNYIYMPMVER